MISLTAVVSLGLLVVAVKVASLSWRTLPYPPSPPGDPFIGHLRVIPPIKTSEAFQKWTKIYGDVVYLRVLNRQIIVLGSVEAAQEMLESKGNNYKCRPYFPIFQLMGWIHALGFLPYGEDFLKQRKMIQQPLGPQEMLPFDRVIGEEASLFVKSLHKAAGKGHMEAIHRYTVSVVMRVAFGHQVKSNDDVFYEIGDAISIAFTSCGPFGNTPVDFFPWLRHLPSWFPGAHYAGVARAYSKTVRRLGNTVIDYVRTGMKSGDYEPSFASQKLEELDAAQLDPISALEELEHIKGAVGSIFVGASDTSKASLDTFFLAMLINPDVQDRAYEEIVSAIGTDILPYIGARESMPYVDAIVQEVLRWNPVTPLGVPHRAMEDATFREMFIPKGSMIVPNLRGMSRDEKIYSNPDVFDPTRFLSKPHGRGEPKFTAAFGFGRRICPGKHFAELSLWHSIASVLATMKIIPDLEGSSPPNLDDAFEVGIVSDTKPFNCKIRVRSEAAQHLISQIE